MTDQVEYLGQSVDYLGFIEAQLRGLRGISTLTYELIQNADDVLDENGNPAASRITFDICDDALIVENDGVFREVDFERMKKLAFGGKRDETGTTGAFGIGFISVYQVTDAPEIFSRGRHWRIRPDMPPDRNIEQKWVPTEFTRFHLPWAFEASEVRRQLRIQTVGWHQLDSFQEEMERAILLASLFLKQLVVLELKRSGQLVRRIERVEEGNQILLDDGDRMIEWRILRGDFSGKAETLRSEYKYQIEKKRQSSVTLAIPDTPLQDGTLFAVLPTEATVPLPFHINADFYPSPDRKRILFDQDYQSEWNRAAVYAAARALASDFAKLPDLLGHKGLWRLLERLNECRRQVERGEHDSAFAAFWKEVAPRLQTHPIVFTTRGQWVAPGEARLLESDAEEAASSILETLDVPVAHPDLRPYFGLMRQKEIGTPLLSVQDVVDALTQVGLDKQASLKQAHPCLRTVQDWQILWRALDALLERRQTPEDREQAQSALRSCVIALDTNETLQPPADLFRGDTTTQALFPKASWMGEYSDLDKMPGSLVAEFTARNGVEFLTTAPAEQLEAAWHSEELDIEGLYRWFESRKSEVLSEEKLRDQLCTLPMWPVSDHLRPLSELYIPGGFDDPLKLSALVDLEPLGGRKEFLKDLGVRELTFETYVREQVPHVLKERPDLSTNARRQLVQLLAQRLGEIRSDESTKNCLSQLSLIECADGVFRPARQVYAQSDVVDILGDCVHVAISVSKNTDAVQALYEWLGVAREPRPKDVIQRIYKLTQNPPDDAVRQVVETVFKYLVGQWSKWDESEQGQYETLKNMVWLPGIGNRTQWYRPGELYAVFRSFLFETQATFLDLARKLQNQAGTVGLIEFLGLKTEPSSGLVVRHLLSCSKRGEQINKEVYRFLNEHADDPAIDQLRDQACLLLPDGYARPDQVYWTEHPFGPFRYQLGPDLRRFNTLFDRLGVREQPEDRDFVQVLREVSEQYGRRHDPLDDQTHAVVMRCWEELSAALEVERITRDDLAELCGREVIPDPRTKPLLAKPENLFFEDRAGLADKFQGFLKLSVIARPQGAWQAMEAVGVRRLSQAVKTHLLECEDPIDDHMLIERVRDRHPLIARVIESERASGVEGLDLGALDHLQFRRSRELMVQYSLQAFRQTRTTEPESVPALLVSGEEALYTVHENGRTPWPAVARELAYAVKSIGEIGGLAGGIKEVLANASFEEARRTLDELGYPPLQERVDTEVTGIDVVEGFGGDELSPEEAIDAILDGGWADRTDMPETPSETPPGGGAPGKDGGKPPKKHKPQGKLRTYVVGEDSGTKGKPDTAAAEHRSKVDQAGIHRVMEHEQAHERTPTEKPHFHEGYDVESRDAEGHVRYIEVKSLSGDWGTRNAAGLTKTQFEMARKRGGQFWLYVVERATSDDYRIHCIQDPANRVNQYLFDDGWQALAEADDASLVAEY